MSRSIDGVANFSALKVGGAMMFAGELLQNDDGPALGDDEGASTCMRCLVHAVATKDPDFPTWLKNKELDKIQHAEVTPTGTLLFKTGAAEVTQVDRHRIVKAMQAGWTPKVDEVWAERRKRDGASRWDESIAIGFRPMRTFLGIEELLCETGCRLLRAISHALNPKAVDYPKGEFKMRARKDLRNVTLLHVVDGAIFRTPGVAFEPGEVDDSTMSGGGILRLQRSMEDLGVADGEEPSTPVFRPQLLSNQGDAMAEGGEEDAVGAQAPPPSVDDIFNGAATEEDDIFTEEQIEADSDDDGTAQKEVAVLVNAANDLVLEQDQMALEDDVVTIAEALARRIAEAPESTPALEILSFGGAKLDSTSGYVEISGAYRELAKVIHPDKLPNSTYAGTAFRRINEAKNILLPPSQPPAPPGETPRDFELSTPHVGVADTPTPFSF